MTGLCVVQAAVNAGLKVRAFVRDEAKIPVELARSVEPFVGDVLNPASVEEAIAGQDSVAVALGTRNDLNATTAMSDGLKNIVNGMRKHGVKKLSVCISAFLFWDVNAVPERFRPVTEDHQRMLDYLKSVDDLDWVAVNPPHIAGTPPTPNDGYVVEEGKSPGRAVSKDDLGHFLMKAATTANSLYAKKIVGITSPQ
jgi:putative NADH-flavin reductase